MTAVADAQAGTVHATVEIAATPDAVFRALTDPDELPRWWGSPDLYRTHDWKLDLRPGGKWSCQARSAQGTGEVRGEVLAVEPPPLLEYTWEPSWEEYKQERRPLHAGEGARRNAAHPVPPGTRLRGVDSQPLRGMDARARLARGTARRRPRDPFPGLTSFRR